MSKFAWVTLTTNDTYSLGALVLAHSLRRAGTAHQLAVLVTPSVSESMRDRLKDVYNVVQEVNVLDSQDAANLALLARPELGITFTKLHCWRLVQFEKCVFLDADTLVLQNCDELFEREELSAAPDVSWPDCFNSGVFVYKPSLDTYNKITEFAVKNGSFDGGDQGLLNQYFADWAHTDIKKHLPFTYNVTAYASYCYLPAFKQFRDKIKILHFAGKLKPWLINFNSENKTAATPSDYTHAHDLIQLWWNIFCDNVHERLTENMCHYLSITPRMQQQSKSNEICFFNQESKTIMNYADHEHVREFRDPWEDYYVQLEMQNETAANVDKQIDYNSNSNQNENLNESTCERTNAVIAADIQTKNQKQIDEQINTYIAHDDAVHEAEATMPTTTTTTIGYEKQKQQLDTKATEVTTTTPTTAVTVAEAVAHSMPTIEPTTTKTATKLEKSSASYIDVNSNKLHAIDSKKHIRNKIGEKQIQEAKQQQQHHKVQSEHEAGLAGALSQLRLGAQRTPEQESYENLMRRQCWESGQIDYSGADSFDNIWKRISQTLEEKPAAITKEEDADKSELLTSADIEDGKIERDAATGATTQYKHIEGGYEVITTTPQPNGTVKTQTRTFWDPKPVSEADMAKEAENRKLVKQRFGKEVRIDKHTTMLTRAIEGGYEEVYTTINDDGTRSMRTKTFYDSVPTEVNEKTKTQTNKKTVTRKSSVDSTDSTESRRVVQKLQQQQQKNVVQNVNDQQSNYREESTIEETRRVTQNIEITENNRTVRKNSLQEQSLKAITHSTTDGAQKKKTKKPKSSAPPPPADFVQNDSTTVASKRVPGGVEYTYSTELESGKTITTSKTVYEEEEVELTEEEIKQYKKTLKDAEKHKNVTTTKKLKSESGTKKIVPSENPGDVTTVETIKIEGGTEYHYTTVTAEGIVKKAVKTVFDPVPSTKANPDDTDEEEIIEEYEEEIIEPGEKNIRTIETVKQLPTKFEEEVTITHEKKEKKVKKSMVISSQ